MGNTGTKGLKDSEGVGGGAQLSKSLEEDNLKFAGKKHYEKIFTENPRISGFKDAKSNRIYFAALLLIREGSNTPHIRHTLHIQQYITLFMFVWQNYSYLLTFTFLMSTFWDIFTKRTISWNLFLSIPFACIFGLDFLPFAGLLVITKWMLLEDLSRVPQLLHDT